MNTFLAIILALTIGADLRTPVVLYQHQGTMQEGDHHQLIYNFYVRQYIPVKLEAKGNGRGDLDCALLLPPLNGGASISVGRDESNLDQCSITYVPTIAEPLRLQVVNHGVHPTNYTVVVRQ